MENIISVIVVIVFLVIVFRKRLVPLFRGKKNPEQSGAAETVADDSSGQKLQVSYFDVIAFDVSKFDNMYVLKSYLEAELERNLLCISKKGEIISIEAYPMSSILIFLVRWKESPGESV